MRNGASTGSDFHWMMSQAFHSGVGLGQHTLVLTWQLFINYPGRFLSFVPYSCNSLASYVGRRVGSLLFEDISHNKPELDLTFLSLLYLYWYYFFFLSFWSFRKKMINQHFTSNSFSTRFWFQAWATFLSEFRQLPLLSSAHKHTGCCCDVVTWVCGTISKQTEEVGYVNFT